MSICHRNAREIAPSWPPETQSGPALSAAGSLPAPKKTTGLRFRRVGPMAGTRSIRHCDAIADPIMLRGSVFGPYSWIIVIIHEISRGCRFDKLRRGSRASACLEAG